MNLLCVSSQWPVSSKTNFEIMAPCLFCPPDPPCAVPALPPGAASPPEGAASPMERPEPGGPHAIPRRHAPIEQLVRQGSFRGFPALSQKNSPFKRQLSLRLNDLPSTLQRKTDFEPKNPGEWSRPGTCWLDL